MRVVLDTNIIVSGLLVPAGAPAQLLELWSDGAFELVTSDAQLDELNRVVQYEHLRTHIHPGRFATFLGCVQVLAIVLHKLPAVSLSADPDDNLILATAIEGKADLIVTGDKRHVLSLGHAEKIPIITARRAIEFLALSPSADNPDAS